jgi:hypothetical protein
MRRPFFMDDLSPDDQRKIRRRFFGVLFAYTAIIALIFAVAIVRRQLSGEDVNSKPCAAAHTIGGIASHLRATHCPHNIKAGTSSLTRASMALR